jgi:hypothetical protein
MLYDDNQRKVKGVRTGDRHEAYPVLRFLCALQRSQVG